MSVHVDRAWKLFELRRFDLAEKELHEALRVEPNDSTAHAMLGYVLARRGEYQRAHEEIDQAVGLWPDSAYAHGMRARIFIMQDHYEKARAAIREALRIQPNNSNSLGLLAWLCNRLGDYDDALAAADAGLASEPEHDACMTSRAFALLGLGKPEEALQEMTRALAIDPTSSSLHHDYGRLCNALNMPGKALQHFTEALRLDPESISAKESFSLSVRTCIEETRGTVIGKSAAILLLPLAFAPKIANLLFGAALNTATWTFCAISALGGLLWMAFSNVFWLQFNADGRALLSEVKANECAWLNAGLVFSLSASVGLMTLGSLNFLEGFLLSTLGAMSVVACWECLQGPIRISLLIVAVTIAACLLGGFTDIAIVGYVLFQFGVIVLTRTQDPIRGLVIREGLRRRAEEESREERRESSAGRQEDSPERVQSGTSS